MTRFFHFKRGVKDAFPIFLGYLAVSFTFGISASSHGLTPWQATLMSLTNLTSAGQFASLALISSSGSYFELAITQLIINLRYSLMSSTLSQKISPSLPFYHRAFMSYGVTDEIFALGAGVHETLSPYYVYGMISSAVPGWALGTLLGAISGNILPARVLSALSVALYGMFIAIIIPPTKTSRTLFYVVASSMLASLAFCALPVLKNISSGFRIIILTVVISAVTALLFPVKEQEAENE